MNPYIASLIGAGVRWLLTLAAAHEISVTTDETTQLVAGAVALVSLAWSWIHKTKVDTKIQQAKAGIL